MSSATLSQSVECATGCCVDDLLREHTIDEVHAAVYAEFMHGYGEVPGLDLGAPIAFTRHGSVYQQEFERGVTVANVGPETVDFALDRGYLDLGYVLCRYASCRRTPHASC